MRYSPMTGMNTSTMPDRIPGAASGSTIWRSVAIGPAPRSRDASRNERSSRSRLT